MPIRVKKYQETKQRCVKSTSFTQTQIRDPANITRALFGGDKKGTAFEFNSIRSATNTRPSGAPSNDCKYLIDRAPHRPLKAQHSRAGCHLPNCRLGPVWFLAPVSLINLSPEDSPRTKTQKTGICGGICSGVVFVRFCVCGNLFLRESPINKIVRLSVTLFTHFAQ